MISSIIVALIGDKIKNIYLPMFIIGMIVSFVDFLTVPIISLGLPLTVYFLIMQKNKKYTVKETIKIIVIVSINWGLGYLLTWVMKWIIVDVLYNKDLIATAIGQVIYRTVEENDEGFIETVKETTILIKYNIIYIAIGSTVLTIIRAIINRKRLKNIKERLIEILPFAVIMLMPFAWYLVFVEHSNQHVPFTYRALLLLLTSLSIIILKMSEGKEYNFLENIKNNPMIKKLLAKIRLRKKLLTGECEK